LERDKRSDKMALGKRWKGVGKAMEKQWKSVGKGIEGNEDIAHISLR
jgi:hypothetical protein